MWPQIQPLQKPVERPEEASLERLFRGDLKGSHYSFEIDLSLCMCPPASSVLSKNFCRKRIIVDEENNIENVQLQHLGKNAYNITFTRLDNTLGEYPSYNFLYMTTHI